MTTNFNTTNHNRNHTKNVYIAGAMTGQPDYNYDRFIATAEQIKALGLHPVHTANMPRGMDWHEYLDISLDLIQECHAVYLIDGWENSNGAKKELQEASVYGLVVVESIEELRVWQEVER